MALCIWAANVRYFYADWSKTVNLKFMIFFFILHPLIFVSVLATDHLLRSGRLPYVHQCKHCRQGKPPTQMYCGDGSEVLDMVVVDGIQCFGLNIEAVILTQIKHQAANGGRVKQRDVSNRVGAKYAPEWGMLSWIVMAKMDIKSEPHMERRRQVQRCWCVCPGFLHRRCSSCCASPGRSGACVWACFVCS